MFGNLFGKKKDEPKRNQPTTGFDFDIHRATVRRLVEFRASGAIPENPMLRSYVALLKTKSKQEALASVRAWSNLTTDMGKEMSDGILKAAKEMGETGLAKDLEERLRWIAGANLPPNAEIPPEENPVLQLALRVLRGQMSLEQAKTEVVSEKNLLRMNEMSIAAITEQVLPHTRQGNDPNQRQFGFYCALLNWLVADKLDSYLNKANCANAVGESILALPSPPPQVLEYGISMFKVAEGLWLQRGETELAGRICVNAAIGLMALTHGDRSLWIEAAIHELETARDFVRETQDPTVTGKVLTLSAMAYLERIKGDRKANAQKAIEFLTEAQKKFSPQSNPAQWSQIQQMLQEARRR